MCFVRELGEGVEVDFISALDANIDWNYPETIIDGYSGVVLGGSGDLDFDGNREPDDEVRVSKISLELVGKLRPLFQYLFDNDIPTLGICYGHQILGAFAGAQVHSDTTQKRLNLMKLSWHLC
jgi:GMP synthase (glutamine-hydrolysing)